MRFVHVRIIHLYWSMNAKSLKQTLQNYVFGCHVCWIDTRRLCVYRNCCRDWGVTNTNHNAECYLVYICSCAEGYEGAYCQVAVASVLPLLISLSTLLPVAAILVVIITIILIYRRSKASRDVASNTKTLHRNTSRVRYICHAMSTIS